MQTLSLYSKLRALMDAGVLHLKSNIDLGHVLPGEGSYFFGTDKVEIMSGVTGRLPSPSGEVLNTPSDVAWVPRTCTVLAHAPTETGPFEIMPPSMRKIVSAFKANTANSNN